MCSVNESPPFCDIFICRTVPYRLLTAYELNTFWMLENIDLQIVEWDAEVSVIIINDSSTEVKPDLKEDYKKSY